MRSSKATLLISPTTIRTTLIAALRRDLIGPHAADAHDDVADSALGAALDPAHTHELLEDPPWDWYLTGFLVSPNAPESARLDPTADEGADVADDAGATDDAAPTEPAAARRTYFPSSIGLSVFVPPGTTALEAVVRWGDYASLPRAEAVAAGWLAGRVGGAAIVAAAKTDVDTHSDTHADADADAPAAPIDADLEGGRRVFRRTPHEARIPLAVASPGAAARTTPIPDSGGLQIVQVARALDDERFVAAGIPAGTVALSVFLVNMRPAPADDRIETTYAFQAELELGCAAGFVGRPDIRGLTDDDPDARIADLQYRDVREHAVGHGVATAATVDADGVCRIVRTAWMPSSDVERVSPATIKDVVLGMEALADIDDAAALHRALDPIVQHYRTWIEAQRRGAPTSPARRAETAAELLHQAARIADRMAHGIDALAADPDALAAFRIANRAMARAARQRRSREIADRVAPQDVAPPAWYPFQLAFQLLALPGLIDPADDDRETVDLLFFPTGGGKTEAYLGLAAFAIVLRRLRHGGAIGSAGVTVLMRYTLRLLTLDQLGRAAALICALELERADDPKLGEWPLEIGLWVGQAATPNRMGRKSDADPFRVTARAKTLDFKSGASRQPPIPLDACPWCGESFAAESFSLEPNADSPTELRVLCLNRDCAFGRGRRLPVVGVDEMIYRRLPCFLIATVDKFAALPWTGETGALFGHVQRSDGDGFYGPSDASGRGSRLPPRSSGAALPAPDLIIQDELHLISGPLGTMAGLYETVIDVLCRRVDERGRTIRPKIIASTATVRRAQTQIRALFGRRDVDVFPAPGPDPRDSFFARTVAADVQPARRYIGVAAQGRSAKVVMLRVYVALLGAAAKAYDDASRRQGRDRSDVGDDNAHRPAHGADNPADAYMTLLGYFNALRELGGARRIVEDEVTARLTTVRRRPGDKDVDFATRRLSGDVLELTSRVPTAAVADAKHRLGLPHSARDHVDIALATNMISVGLDITRLGLMVVSGQPKTMAEYIQATSRVGRDVDRPGLVVTLFNIHKARDRSHFERFEHGHATFYRQVEATSVTPFAARALDRGLPAVLVALIRHGSLDLAAPKGASRLDIDQAAIDAAIQALVDRATDHADLPPAARTALSATVRDHAQSLVDAWRKVIQQAEDESAPLQYGTELKEPRPLLYDYLDPRLEALPPSARRFRAGRSLRDVEPTVDLWPIPPSDRPQGGTS